MYCAAFVSSPGEGRKLLQAICRQRSHRLLYVGLERKRSAQRCRNSIPVMDQPRENGRIVASMRSRDRLRIRGLRFSSQHSRPRLCWVISSSTSLSIFRARKTACCRAPKIAQPSNCRPTDNFKKLRQLSSEGFERLAERSPPGAARRPSVATSRIHCLLGFAG